MRFLSALLLISFLYGEAALSFPYGDEHDVTLVVGNTRKAGQVNKGIAQVVAQESADFTHRRSFKGVVVSLDRGSPRDRSFPHIVEDATTLTHPALRQSIDHFSSGRPLTRIFFEWFPSCVMESRGSNLKPLLAPALRNLLSILASGGEVLIDLMPYACSLASDKSAALRELAACNTDRSVMDLSREIRDETPGILSKRLQDADPFTLHWSRLEVADIRGCFAAHLQKADTLQRDPQTNFEAAKKAAVRISLIFKKPLQETMQHLVTNLASSPFDPMVCTFEWIYHMESRAPLMKATLREMGLSLGEDGIKYYPVNPFNGRKHAWILRGIKADGGAAPASTAANSTSIAGAAAASTTSLL